MKVRCKFHLQEIRRYSGYPDRLKAVFRAVGGGSAENESFTKYTPSGVLEIDVDNPAVVDSLTLGSYYYLDLIPCE